jgi:cytochrome P450
MTTATALVLDRWGSRASRGDPFDVSADMSQLTLDVVGRTLFGRGLADRSDLVSGALLEALDLMNHRVTSFLPSPIWWPSSANRRLRRAIGTLDRVVYEIIDTRRRRRGRRRPTLHVDGGDETGATRAIGTATR